MKPSMLNNTTAALAKSLEYWTGLRFFFLPRVRASQRDLLEAIVQDLEERKVNDTELGLGKEYDKAITDIQTAIREVVEGVK